jgi:hypothetical protein
LVASATTVVIATARGTSAIITITTHALDTVLGLLKGLA